MKLRHITGLLTLLCCSSLLPAQETSPAHVGILYPLSTHGDKAAAYTNHFSLHALWGVSGGEKGLGLYGAAGTVKGDASGVQAAGVFNGVGGELKGVQLAGVMNRAHTMAGGAQFAGVLNVTGGRAPVQLAGTANVTDSVKGAQVAGVANVAGHVQGVQIGGVVNKAGKVSGVQIAGLLNIADSSDYPIAIINIIRNGEKRVGISTDENLFTMVSFRSGGRRLYGLVAAGVSPLHSERRYAAEGGLGISLVERNAFRLDMETGHLFATDFEGHEYYRSGLRLLPALRLGSHVHIFGGPGMYYASANTREGAARAGWELWERQRPAERQSIYLGGTVGLQLVL